jgi:bifunctional non-homologous end joining protein LigD
MQTTLYYRQGGSDKIYQAAIEEVPGGFVVNFAYGRRGATLQTGTKTTSPVTREEAQKIHDRLIASKTAKGYTPAADGTPYQATGDEGRNSGIHCQLLNPVDENDLPGLLGDSRHVLQEKHDGRRLLVRKHCGEIHGINRRGLVVSLPRPIAEAAGKLPVDILIDGEAVGDVLHAFDLLEIAGHDVRPRGYLDRFAGLLRLLGPDDAIRPVSTVTEPDDKKVLYRTLLMTGAEGVVFKNQDAAYTSGRPASGGPQLKFKFVASASFIVAAVNRKRSVALALLDGGGEVPAGNVTIPPNHDIPSVGEVIEARYLYAFRESGHIYQPVYLGRRDDIPAEDCTVSQLKFKSESLEGSAA